MIEEHMNNGQWPDVLKMHGMDVAGAEKRFHAFSDRVRDIHTDFHAALDRLSSIGHSFGKGNVNTQTEDSLNDHQITMQANKDYNAETGGPLVVTKQSGSSGRFPEYSYTCAHCGASV